MARRTRTGKRFAGLVFLIAAALPTLHAQNPVLGCVASAVPALIPSEGIAERIGDVLIQCSGGVPGTVYNGNLNLLLPVSITNRIDSGSHAADAVLSVGSIPSGIQGVVSSQNIAFNGVRAVLDASGSVVLKISGVRVNANQLGMAAPSPIQAFLSLQGFGSLALGNNPVAVAQPSPGLVAAYSSATIRCAGSPLPADINIASLFAAGTRFSSIRVTEGFAAAFRVRQVGDDSGIRITVRYTGFPAGARVFVPDVIAGSSAAERTAAGDLGLTPSGGRYVPSSGTLLLSRVLYTDTNGAGGMVAYTPPAAGSPAVTFNTVSEVPLSGGQGLAVYEVVDANSGLRESAQIPTFFGIANPQPDVIAQAQVSFAPISAIASASDRAPVPRFAAVAPGSDCPAVGDCDAAYFPQLNVPAAPIVFTATAGGAAYQQFAFIPVQNARGGVLNWTATVTYKNGADWLTLENASGLNSATVRVWARPQKLPPGTYQAAITVDAGPLAGSKSVPVTLIVASPGGAPAGSPVVVTRLVNGASFAEGPVAAGSLATIQGSKLAGSNVAVTFDGIAAKLLYTGDMQINLRVPQELAGRSSAQLVASVDGLASAPLAVALAPIAPGIFSNGILNQDNSVNTPESPAPSGTVIQIFATGLPSDGSGVFVRIQDRDNIVPLYAGPAPGLDGVEQVNAAIPADLPAMTANLLVCANAGGQRYCSAPVQMAVGR